MLLRPERHTNQRRCTLLLISMSSIFCWPENTRSQQCHESTIRPLRLKFVLGGKGPQSCDRLFVGELSVKIRPSHLFAREACLEMVMDRERARTIDRERDLSA